MGKFCGKKVKRCVKRLFCLIGRHWLENHSCRFVDRVDGKEVFKANCACGRLWLVNSIHPLFGYRLEKESEG